MGITGDFGKLARIRAGFRQMRQRGTFVELNKALAITSQQLVRQCFTSGRTPHGVPWKRLKTRDGSPLMDTRRLFSSIETSYGTRGYRVFSNLRYARMQNNGATIVPRNAAALSFVVKGKRVYAQKVVVPGRQFMPRGRLPWAWRAALQKTSNGVVRATMGLR